MRDSQLFDNAVGTFFEPLAKKWGFALFKVRDGVFDIQSPHYIMRIRLHTGHHRGLNVILRPASFLEFDENKSGIELGIGCFNEFYGGKLSDVFINVFSDANFIEQARLLALVAERYGGPYLTGEGKDWKAVKEMIERKTEKEVETIKKYRFPKNVREEWPLPED